MSYARTLESATLVDTVIPATRAADAAAVAVMAGIIALCAQIQIPLPFTPVPITGSTLGVLYAGALLGPRRGLASVGLYLLMGGIGLPFYAGGDSGWTHFAGATGGYLVGFAPAAWVTGMLARRGWDRTPARAFLMMLLGSVVVFAFGLAGLSRVIPAGELLSKGLYPFIPGDIIKAALSAGLLPLGWRWLGNAPRRH